MTCKDKTYRQLTICSCNLVRRSARKITQFYERNLREAGIKPTQFSILAALANTGPVPLTQLADRLLLERTSLTRNLNVLERHGWVKLKAGEEDLRQRVVSLSEKGYAKVDQAIPYWQKSQKAIADELGWEAMNGLKTILGELTENVTKPVF